MADHVGEKLGNYRLTQLLGQGGFGEVYLGVHLHLNTQAAIKVLSGKVTPQEQQDFKIEAQKVAKLKHTHIIRILDFGVDNNFPFLVMDYAAQGSLRDIHPLGSILPLSTILSYTKPVAAALQHAHDEKIIHRDVKPDNMLVDSNNNILLSDFGIAVIAHRTQSMTRQEPLGTAVYMSPEQIKGNARPASDQYALAIVVYEWLTGTVPFDGYSGIEIAMKQMSEPPPPFKKDLKVSPQVEAVVLKALAKDPQQRFASVQEFAVALEKAFHQQSTLIVPPAPQPKSPIPPTVKVPTPAKVSLPQGTVLWTYSESSKLTYSDIEWLSSSQLAISGKGEVQILDVATGNIFLTRSAPDTILDKLRDSVDWHLGWFPDYSSFYCWCRGSREIHIYDASTKMPTKTLTLDDDVLYNALLAPNGRSLASVTLHHKICIWSITSGKIITAYKGHTKAGSYSGFYWSPDSTRIASMESYNSEKLHIWEASTGRRLAIIKFRRFVEFMSMAIGWEWSPDGKYIAFWEEKTVQVADVNSGKIFMEQNFPDKIVWVRWSPDSKYIALRVSKTNVLSIYQISTGNTLSSLKSSNEFYEIEWSPNGAQIASLSMSKDFTAISSVSIWNTNTGQNTYTYTAHSSGVYALAWSPDGTKIASISENEIILWQVA